MPGVTSRRFLRFAVDKQPRMEQARENVVIVVVPFLGQGHLNPLLHFALHLSSRGLPVHFASSSSHNRQARTRLQGWAPTAVENVHFHDLPVPPFPSPPADPNSANKFPSHRLPAYDAYLQLRSPLGPLLRSLSSSSRRLVIVHDQAMAFACSEADALPNAETYRFQSVAASFMLSVLPRELIKLEDTVLKQEARDLVLVPLEDDSPPELREFFCKHMVRLASEAGIVMNTCRPIDDEFIEHMARLPGFVDKKLFAVGPINPVAAKRGGDGGKRHGCLEWLDKQPRASVVYVSFGCTTTISDEQVEQLATGLERGGQRFVWFLRDADRGDIFASGGDDVGRRRELPAGFEGKLEGTGLVVTGWAPQLEILAHPSTGAFMSHCGWNSCMESLSHGVPMIAWPMHSDQPRNALVVADYLKAGAMVRDWDRRREVVSAPEIETAIKRMMAGEEGEEIRARAESLGKDIRHAVAVGSSRADFDSFVAHITRG